MMLSIFSCFLAICMFWEIIYSGLMPYFNLVVCYFDVELYELFEYF